MKFTPTSQHEAIDLCQFVMVCAFEDWQIQVSPGARSDLGGAQATFKEICRAHQQHALTEHTKADLTEMRQRLIIMGAPEETTKDRGDGDGPDAGMTGMLTGVPLPRWWVHKR